VSKELYVSRTYSLRRGRPSGLVVEDYLCKKCYDEDIAVGNLKTTKDYRMETRQFLVDDAESQCDRCNSPF